MYYIEDQDPILVKKDVIADKMTLGKLYQEILLKFGHYEHRECDVCDGPYEVVRMVGDDIPLIRNYTETADSPQGESGHRRCEYEEYCVPELADLIKRILEEDENAFEELMHIMPESYPSELKKYYTKVMQCFELRPVMSLYKEKWNELRRIYRDVCNFYEGTGQFEKNFRKNISSKG